MERCRICYMDEGKLISPCNCKGSIKFVHKECLTEWLKYRIIPSCEVCNESLTEFIDGYYIDEDDGCCELLYAFIFMFV